MSDSVNTKLTRRLHITREEEADRCLNHTVYSKGTQAILVILFLLIVGGVPVAQHFVEIRHNLAKRATWDPKSGQPEPRLLPQVYDVFSLLPTIEQVKQAKGFWGYWSLIPSGESISSFETSLKENSILTQALLSPAQSVMTGDLGVGNEKAYCGQDGWLFYRPDVEYVTSDGFLDPVRLKSRARGSTAIQPDPVKAILDLKLQLQDRGIRLVVLPMSTKPMVEPEMLTGSSADGLVMQNPSFSTFVQDLKQSGVEVFDPTPILLQRKQASGVRQFLKTDTHWTPGGMETVAGNLAAYLTARFPLPAVSKPRYRASQVVVSNVGDIAEMLKLPNDQALYPRQQVSIRRITLADGSDWQADRHSDVLLLGDSFANIYSLGGMGWGSSAGFAEQMSYALDRPIDKIAINAGGSYASRRALAQQLATGTDRLTGKKVVVYEFSMRDLTEGDWKIIHFAHPKPAPLEPQTAAPTPVKPVQATKPIARPTEPKPVLVKPLVSNPVTTIPKNPTVDTKKTETGPAALAPITTKTDKRTIAKPSAPAGLIVTGRIAARATTPKPGSVPYKDCLIALQLTDLHASGGSIKGTNIVVYVWGMKDNQLVDGLFTVGQTLKFKLTPWASVESKYGEFNRQELESDDALSWAAFWGEIGK